MNNDSIESEWREICQRLVRRAKACDAQEAPGMTRRQLLAKQFASQETPRASAQLQQRKREVAALEESWQLRTDANGEEASAFANELDFDWVQEAGEDSFPASDPPAWSSSTL